eukprot:CAMPEP_0202427662 /NCGR_PEP_ID=MMETSP1345-20130828/1840_1 /ASSEMBLY_ACC=CAM_ASM_000843 /TAXON_ID=342563 /ORGANISM="Fabrea Fabrea salina" /LENGTH=148 /DNA_ID=CAMNT_0049038433 /DNA_START=55 /DNA_END=497 /DNA_ORIENTATION=-
MLCAHKVIEHLDRGHIIYPLPYHVRLNPIFDEEDVILECNESILDELREMSTRKIIELQELEEEVEDSVYMNEEPLTIGQVKERVDALEPINEFLSRLNYELTVRFLKGVVVSGSADNTIRVWEDGQARVLEGHTGAVYSVAVSLKKG